MDLQAMFSQGNPFLAQMAEKQWNTEQQRREQDLQTSLQQAQRAQEMHPIEMASKKAYGGLAEAQTAQMKHSVDSALPADQARQQKISEWAKNLSENEYATEMSKITRRNQWAAAAAKNGGVLPLEYMQQLPENERAYFANPETTKKTLALTQAFLDAAPKARQFSAGLESKEAIAALMAAARKATAGSGSKAGKENLEQYLVTLNKQIAGMPAGPERDSLQAEADRTEVQILRKMVAGRQAAQAGQINPAATAEQGKPVINPPFEASPTPRKQEWTPPSGWK